jgi:hypothetical protein
MNFMMVEPINTKLTAYHFDGSKESALEAIDKWDGVMSSVNTNWYDSDNTSNNSTLYKFTLKSGREILPGDYIVIENGELKIYKQSEFVTKFKIVYDIRDRLGNFMSEDL